MSLDGGQRCGRCGRASLGSISFPQTPPCYPNLSRRQEMELSPRQGLAIGRVRHRPPRPPPANLPGPRPNNSRAADPGSANASTQSNSLSRSVSDTACVPPGTTTPLARPTRGPTRGPTQVSPHPWVDCHQSKLGNSPDESNHACGPMGRRCELMGATWTSYRIRVQSPLLGRECSCWHVGEAS